MATSNTSDYQKQLMQMQHASMTQAGKMYIGSSDPYGLGVTTTSTGGGYTLSPGNYTYTNGLGSPTPFTAEGEWEAADNQAAAGKGWFIVHSYAHPTIKPLEFGSKAGMSDEAIMQDVVEQAMAGCPVGRKVLAILTKNRSPYAQWAKLSESLNERS